MAPARAGDLRRMPLARQGVKSQALPWVNVNDGKGTTSPSIALYNVNEIPSSVLVAPGTVSRISGVDALEKEFARLLK